MQRNWILYRQILLFIEEEASSSKPWLTFKSNEWSEEQVAEHVKMLHADQMITMRDLSSSTSSFAFYPVDVTAKGRELAEHFRNDVVWRYVKGRFNTMGKTASLTFVQSLIRSAMRDLLG